MTLMLSIHWLSAHARINLCLFLPYISVYTQKLRLFQIICHSMAVKEGHRLFVFTAYSCSPFLHLLLDWYFIIVGVSIAAHSSIMFFSVPYVVKCHKTSLFVFISCLQSDKKSKQLVASCTDVMVISRWTLPHSFINLSHCNIRNLRMTFE
jgi:hypothetical protein